MTPEQEFVRAELDRLATMLAEHRMQAVDTRLWGLACLTEAAYILRAARAGGVLSPEHVLKLLLDATEVVFEEPERPVRVVRTDIDTEGKLN